MILGTDGNLWVATAGNLIRVPPSNPAGLKSLPDRRPVADRHRRRRLAPGDSGRRRQQRVVTATITDPPVLIGLPDAAARTQGVAWGPNGQFAYTQPVNEPKTIGLITPPAKTPLIDQRSRQRPFRDHARRRRRLLVAERNDDKLFRITTDDKVSSN